MSRKTNRDHAKRQQRPMQEDAAVSPRASAAAPLDKYLLC
jgi:hypothetical protein